MRTLAIDLGTRRIGLAMSDEGARWATPLEVLFVTDPQQAIDPILNLIKTEDVKRVVIGLPINMDNTLGPAARQVITWTTTGLAASAASSSIPLKIIYVDERLSSFAAEQQLTERKKAGEKLTHKKKKRQQDAIAAAGFLQAYLDGKLPAIDLSRVELPLHDERAAEGSQSG